MQVLKRHRLLVLTTLLFVIALIVSVLVLVQNAPKPITSSTPTPTPTPAPSISPSPTINTPISPSPTVNTPSPTTTNPSPSQTPTSSTPALYLFPGEITQYQDQSLTPISVYIEYLNVHPDVAIAGVQNIDPAAYKLAITGMINNPTNYSYGQVVNGFNSTLQVATLPCVEGWSVTMLWQGVSINSLLQQAGVSPNATTLIFLAADGYTTSLPLDFVIQNNIMIAYKMNNVTLTAKTGWPFFLVAKSQYGYKWIEWISEINVSNNSSYLGYWESRGYPNDATVISPSNNTAASNNTQIVLAVTTVSIACVVIVAAAYMNGHKSKKLPS